MTNLLIISFLISAVVVFVMVKQINKITNKIDENAIKYANTNIYADFSAHIQEALRAIRADIKNTNNEPIYVLINEENQEQSLEFLADNIRKLVAFESMGAKSKAPKQTEKELFEILSSIDEFLNNFIQNGEKLADDLREDFAKKFNELKMG